MKHSFLNIVIFSLFALTISCNRTESTNLLTLEDLNSNKFQKKILKLEEKKAEHYWSVATKMSVLLGNNKNAFPDIPLRVESENFDEDCDNLFLLF